MSNITATINQLNTAASVTTLILSLISCVPGIIGLILNLFVFTCPTLRRESCSLYFLSSTCVDLFVVLIIMPVRVVSSNLNIDLSNNNVGICKIEFYAFYTMRVISFWLVVLACIDRFLHSSTDIRMRRLSSLKTARFSIRFTIIILILSYSHTIIYYEITSDINNIGQTISTCYGRKGFYRTFIALWHMIMYSLCPSLLMLIFGCLTLNNIHQQRRVLPAMVVTNSRVTRRTDGQLLRMLTAQVLVIIISTLPFSIYRLYASFTANIVKDTLRLAQENLAGQIANTMPYFAHSSSFYLYTLTGSIFRKELLKTVAHYLPHRRNLRDDNCTNP